jgi:hypothetical protein
MSHKGTYMGHDTDTQNHMAHDYRHMPGYETVTHHQQPHNDSQIHTTTLIPTVTSSENSHRATPQKPHHSHIDTHTIRVIPTTVTRQSQETATHIPADTPEATQSQPHNHSYTTTHCHNDSHTTTVTHSHPHHRRLAPQVRGPLHAPLPQTPPRLQLVASPPPPRAGPGGTGPQEPMSWLGPADSGWEAPGGGGAGAPSPSLTRSRPPPLPEAPLRPDCPGAAGQTDGRLAGLADAEMETRTARPGGAAQTPRPREGWGLRTPHLHNPMGRGLPVSH